MRKSVNSITYLDGPRIRRALVAGINHLFQRREYLNKINVFPVPDGDTGTNMAFTFKTVQESLAASHSERVDELFDLIAESTLDGARGNSGAIMAQFFQGMREAASGSRLLTAGGFARAAARGSAQAWKAMSEPVEGTLPTVLQAFSDKLVELVDAGERDIHVQLRQGLAAAQDALAGTPRQLAVLKAAGVVDAGGQGFVDLLEGVWAFITEGRVDEAPRDIRESSAAQMEAFEPGQHRYCTECVVEGEGLKRDLIMSRLEAMDVSSLVVAGSAHRMRVHVHTDSPGDVFLSIGAFGEIREQKAEDMARQHGLLNQTGTVAVVTDSGADLPAGEIERLGIHVVPVRLSFGDQEFLDGVTLDCDTFTRMLAECTEPPLTSQPPVQDFTRQYALLTSHGYDVISVGLSKQLSGTTGAAIQSASGFDEGSVRVIDTLSATCGQGLLAIAAAEAAQAGYSADEVEALVLELIPRTQVFAIARDLSFAVRGGRVPAWVKSVTDALRLVPLMTASKTGRMKPGGVILKRSDTPESLGRAVVKKMEREVMYRVLVAHVGDAQGAVLVRRTVLAGHSRVHSCHICNAGPALGVHLGPGGLIVAFMPDPAILQ